MLKTLIIWYRFQPFKRRVAFAALLLLIPLGVSTSNDVVESFENLATSQGELDAAKLKFAEAKKLANGLPQMQKALTDSEIELEKASKRLPDEFFMDKVVQKTAMIAQSVGVLLRNFDPGKGTASNTAYRYMSMPISLAMSGSYSEIATFFDQIAHLEMMVHIRDIKMEVEKGARGGATMTKGSISSQQSQMLLSRDIKVAATATMYIYRALKLDEDQQLPASDQQSEMPPLVEKKPTT